jgi:hypothetical protein
MWVDKRQLQIEIRRAQRTRRFSPKLVAMLDEMFHGIALRFHHGEDRDDMHNEMWLWWLNSYRLIDTRRDSFNFITTCCRNIIRREFRDGTRHRTESLGSEKTEWQTTRYFVR